VKEGDKKIKISGRVAGGSVFSGNIPEKPKTVSRRSACR
jgi:hypothetical protein